MIVVACHWHARTRWPRKLLACSHKFMHVRGSKQEYIHVALHCPPSWFGLVSFFSQAPRAGDIEMADWGPVVVAVVLFVLLSPGLLLQLPAKGGRFVEFGNFQTSGASIFVHAIIFFALAAVFLIAIGVHITTD